MLKIVKQFYAFGTAVATPFCDLALTFHKRNTNQQIGTKIIKYTTQ